jgi:predicted nuclease of predicted toxin-antitoxin system
MARLYANENFPRQVVAALRANGHDVLTTVEAAQANKELPDAEVLAYATRTGRAVLTLNRRDFIRLHRERPKHAGIIVCAQDPDVVGQAERIHAVLAVAGELTGQLLRINLPWR